MTFVRNQAHALLLTGRDDGNECLRHHCRFVSLSLRSTAFGDRQGWLKAALAEVVDHHDVRIGNPACVEKPLTVGRDAGANSCSRARQVITSCDSGESATSWGWAQDTALASMTVGQVAIPYFIQRSTFVCSQCWFSKKLIYDPVELVWLFEPREVPAAWDQFQG
jgi:hypothetical protein